MIMHVYACLCMFMYVYVCLCSLSTPREYTPPHTQKEKSGAEGGGILSRGYCIDIIDIQSVWAKSA